MAITNACASPQLAQQALQVLPQARLLVRVHFFDVGDLDVLPPASASKVGGKRSHHEGLGPTIVARRLLILDEEQDILRVEVAPRPVDRDPLDIELRASTGSLQRTMVVIHS